MCCGADYIRTARAKGLREGGGRPRHRCPTRCSPLVTVLGLEPAGAGRQLGADRAGLRLARDGATEHQERLVPGLPGLHGDGAALRRGGPGQHLSAPTWSTPWPIRASATPEAPQQRPGRIVVAPMARPRATRTGTTSKAIGESGGRASARPGTFARAPGSGVWHSRPALRVSPFALVGAGFLICLFALALAAP